MAIYSAGWVQTLQPLGIVSNDDHENKNMTLSELITNQVIKLGKKDRREPRSEALFGTCEKRQD